MISIDTKILAALRSALPGAISGAELSQRLDISRTAIWAHIEQLRTLGYEIEASPHLGYRLLHTPDVLFADDLLSRLGNQPVIGRDIRVFQETTSTNDIAEKLAVDGVKEGAVVIAESQTQGRGRLGRSWISQPRKGLWFSVLLRPKISPQAATQFTAGTAVALARAIRRETSLAPAIKWPNDIFISGRKVAGILTEMTAELDSIHHLIIGMGININHESGDFPPDLQQHATSLCMEAKRSFCRADVTIAILEELELVYRGIQDLRFAAIAEEWERLSSTLGQRVSIQMGNRILQGVAESLDADGALLLRTQHGRLERIIGGDVSLLK